MESLESTNMKGDNQNLKDLIQQNDGSENSQVFQASDIDVQNLSRMYFAEKEKSQMLEIDIK